jgi:translation initiation factor IF-3
MKKKPEVKRRFRINEEIKSFEVRLVGEGEPKVVTLKSALMLASELSKDLILINEKQNPPIVKIEDYNKYIYDLEKIEKERKKKNKTELKEIQLSVSISDNDLKTKIKKGIEFLKDGDKVKCSLLLKGRQKAAPERGELVVLRFLESLTEFGLPESLPKYEGSKWIVLIKPKTK